MDTHIRVDTGVTAETAGRRNDFAAVDHQPAVGVDAITFAGGTIDHNIHLSTVDGSDGNRILIGVDAIIAGVDIDDAAVDGQMQFGVKTFILGVDIQNTITAVDVHRLLGIESSIVLMEFFAVNNGFTVFAQFDRFVNTGNIGAIDGVFGAVNDENIGSCSGSIHIFGGGFFVRFAALINIVENHTRSNGTGDVHAVEVEIHHRIWVFFGLFSQINGNLTGRESATKLIIAGLCDVNNGVLVGFFLTVLIIGSAFAISEVLPLQIENNIMSGIYSGTFVGSDCFAVDGDAFIR